MLTMLDIVALVLLSGCAVLGLIRGFVTEVLSLAAWVLAVVALKFLGTPVTALFEGVIATHAGAAVLAFVLIFLVTYFVGKMAATAIGRRTRTSILGPVDRILGFGFGGLKGLLAATLLFLALNLGYDFLYGGQAERPEFIAKSRTYPLLNASGRSIMDWVKARQRAGAGAADNAADPPLENATE